MSRQLLYSMIPGLLKRLFGLPPDLHPPTRPAPLTFGQTNLEGGDTILDVENLLRSDKFKRLSEEVERFELDDGKSQEHERA